MKTQKTHLEKTLLTAIENSDLSLYTIAQRAGISYPQVYHFTHGNRTLTLPAAGRLAAALGLELTPNPKPTPAAPDKRRPGSPEKSKRPAARCSDRTGSKTPQNANRTPKRKARKK